MCRDYTGVLWLTREVFTPNVLTRRSRWMDALCSDASALIRFIWLIARSSYRARRGENKERGGLS